jgi:mRNA interferase RelE/StbE
MAYTLVYHPEVGTIDVPTLNRDIAKRVKPRILNRLSTDPQDYGEPLRRTLKGYWKLRCGDYRVVFKVVENEVWIFGIMHRREVYRRIEKRLSTH